MAEDKKTTAAPKNIRTRAANKPKSRGRILGDVIDQFEAMSPDVLEEVMSFLRGKYPHHSGPATFDGLGAKTFAERSAE